MKLSDYRRLGWDTETTGVQVHEARIVTAALVVRGGNLPDRTFSYIINPQIPIPAAASAVHGITDERAQAEGADPKEALEEIASRLTAALVHGMPVVAFNQSFDWSVLHYDLARHGLLTMADRLDGDPATLLDPHVIDRQCTPKLRGKGLRKLKPTCERYGVALEDWHTAEADALAALLLADAQFDYHPQLNEMGPQQLFAAQRAWRAEQQTGLQEFLRKSEPSAYCAPEWPLIPAQRGEGE
ncbi:exonuclease domain-containing protein [Streptomyces sp. ActVer]|uniref:exonuclease domain-containing protein n=1 Tax=Streptomyces sp. ActVer TaxID=3014558 RepID=UPI0022B5920D|nr:exonuclease domain-containing protein [Streptomyces sp. ActVer]MCZ4514534.1 exonuclease domain-containing protein [Streptomyces sp. ActVer]